MTGNGSDPGSEVDPDAVGTPPPVPESGPLAVGTDETTHVYHLDPHESPCIEVVSAVAAVTGREPMSLGPLYEAVDPDALDRLVGGPGADSGDGSVRVTFTYAGTAVTVDSTGRIHLYR